MHWLRRTAKYVVGVAVAVALNWFWDSFHELAKEAVLEWVNHAIAERFGWTDPSVSQVIDFAILWGVPIGLVAGVWSLATWSERWRQSAQISANAASSVSSIDKRISSLELMREATSRGWKFPGDRDALFEFARGLQQAVSDGDVVLWGIDLKQRMDILSAAATGVLERVPAGYMKDHWIDLHQALMHSENDYAMTTAPGSLGREDSFSNLHFDRQQALHWLDSGRAAAILAQIPIRTKLTAQVGETGQFFETSSRSLHSSTRIYKLLVANTEAERTIFDIHVKLLSLEPSEGQEGPWDLSAKFDLAAGDYTFLPLVSYGEGETAAGYSSPRFERGNTFFEIITKQLHPKLSKENPCTLTLRITGRETAPCDFKCKVWVDRSDGRLRISEVLGGG